MLEVWLINGIPGAGKTTVAHALAARHACGVHIEGDRLQEMVITGGVLPGGQPAAEADRQIHLNVRNQCLLACSFAEAGFVPVIDYVVVNRARVEEYRRQLPGLLLRLVTLVPDVTVALERDRQRPEKSVAPRWAHLDEHMRAELQGIGLRVDSSRMTVAETVDYILAEYEAAYVPEVTNDE